jgi:hypothetical protein
MRRFYDKLVITNSTRLLENNVNPKVVQELLGYSSISITLDIYSYIMPEVKRDATDKINHLFDKSNYSITNDNTELIENKEQTSKNKDKR